MRDRFVFGTNAWLIAYDIADPRRLGRVHRLLKKVAVPIQYSVFLAWLNERQLRWLVEQLRSRIRVCEDDVRLYHLPVVAELTVLGRQWMPDGVHLFRNGVAVQGMGASIASENPLPRGSFDLRLLI